MDEILAWLADPARWSGSDSIPVRVLEHLELSSVSVLAALALAVPLGAFIGHTGHLRLLAVAVANVGRAMPTLALMVIFLPLILRAGLGLGFWPTVAPLVLLAIPPMLVNTYVGVADVDRDVRDAARGLGMRGHQVLLGVELPLAAAAIFAGVRIASVQVIATATLGALVASGGLGRYIIDGFALQETPRMVAGALLVALLALAVDRLLAVLEARSTRAGANGTTEPRTSGLARSAA
ncbi:MAG: ABC transporter permease [Chloroflexota bacterium]|nr:ABC transporter permease [Chloroflexota bacterium]